MQLLRVVLLAQAARPLHELLARGTGRVRDAGGHQLGAGERGDGTHATFRDVIAFLPEVQAMGFDVLYLPPIHPIGMTERKGKNNA
ncbi:MAG TPA: hypothetical protein VIV54_17240, partial [Burkholderiales bacterium]